MLKGKLGLRRGMGLKGRLLYGVEAGSLLPCTISILHACDGKSTPSEPGFSNLIGLSFSLPSFVCLLSLACTAVLTVCF
ncbi:hypothetical protein F5Y09DRAFT_300228 [Xylaria sp. FL1042]|nr:hypothetical protein F5Y09DRAFT_300228 [Xylaria sp. FL1042]